MLKQYIIALLLGLSSILEAQSLYFPPLLGSNWETQTPESLDWCTENLDTLINFLDAQDSKAFIILKDGKIVIEQYYDDFGKDSLWYWASAGKTITSLAVGIAQQEGLLGINDKSSEYLGEGWTSCSNSAEDSITVRHQLTMTTGLDDNVEEEFCTLDTCLLCLAAPNTRWAYHNAPYTLLDDVIENASDQTLNQFFTSRVRNKIGMNGLFIPVGYNNIYISNARSMARFGLLMLNKGTWNNNVILSDTSYYQQMTNTSQDINPSYGYLWWLNGKSSYMVPSSQIVFQGPLFPAAPDDMISALGANGQMILIVPSQNLVIIRMGNSVEGGLVSLKLANDVWELLGEVICTPSANEQVTAATWRIYPNPSTDYLHIEGDITNANVQIINQMGATMISNIKQQDIDIQSLKTGIYTIIIRKDGYLQREKFVKL